MFLISPKHDTTAEKLPLLKHLRSDQPKQEQQNYYWLSVSRQQWLELTELPRCQTWKLLLGFLSLSQVTGDKVNAF